MNLNDFISKGGGWLKGTGPCCGIAISSRIRLARNLKAFAFPNWNKEKSQDVLDAVETPILKSSFMEGGSIFYLGDLNKVDRQFLLERHLVSPEFIANDEQKRAVVVSSGENVSVMVNEEDHLRIQVIESGFDIANAWNKINEFDDELGSKVEYAYSTNFGYLTACPTNTGTGLRGSVMLHLPALILTKKINHIIQAIVKIGLAARGFYGEGSDSLGNFFQISNQITLGYKEEDMLKNLQDVVGQIIESEQLARQSLLKNKKVFLEDRIWRAYGLLKSAYVISSNEAAELLSSVRLGVDLGLIKDIDTKSLNELFITIQPAHLQKWTGKILSPSMRDLTRAELIRAKFKV